MKRLMISIGYVAFFVGLSGCGTQTSSWSGDGEDSWEQDNQAALIVELSTSTYPLDAIFDSCQGETYEGRCVGNILTWCEDYRVRSVACKRACGWDRSNCYNNCL